MRSVLAVMRREPRYVLGVADQVPPDGLESRLRRVAAAACVRLSSRSCSTLSAASEPMACPRPVS